MNSLPGIVAASPRATRLAIANWKTITVWPLEPHAIIERNAGDVYPENMIDAGVTGTVLLEPMVLESEAVCFMLRFAEGEDEIVSLTDRGVMRWEIGAGAVGRKEGVVLEVQDGVRGSEVESEEEGEGEGKGKGKKKRKGKGGDVNVGIDGEEIFIYEGEGENGNEMDDDEDERDYDVDGDEDEEMEDDDSESESD